VSGEDEEVTGGQNVTNSADLTEIVESAFARAQVESCDLHFLCFGTANHKMSIAAGAIHIANSFGYIDDAFFFKDPAEEADQFAVSRNT
jgi:hypothetical protein